MGAPRPASGHSQAGRDALQPGRLRLGVGGDGGSPLRRGGREGNRRERVATPLALEAGLAWGVEGVRGLVAARTATRRRTLGIGLEPKLALVPCVPRTGAIRHAREAGGRQQAALPCLVEKPGRTQDAAPRCGHGHRVRRQGEVEDSDGRVAWEARRFVVGHARQRAHQPTQTSASGPAQAAEAVAAHVTRVQARWCACLPDAEAAVAA
jgi:hypothetical protein